jgi:glyoxylase-like metal-dependent hydrolase (beta-lactamase superfamily II)
MYDSDDTGMNLARIDQLRLTASQVYLVQDTRPILIDVGFARDEALLISWLARQGIAPRDLGAIILTHAHADHAGAIAAISLRAGVPVIAGAGDIATLRAGGEAGWEPGTRVRRTLARLGLTQSYPPLPDHIEVIAVTSPLRLAPFGVAGSVLPVPGHTAGSVAVVLDSGEAIAGDMVIGGYLLGQVVRSQPVGHIVHFDRAQNRASLDTLLATGAHTWHLGHGGPLSADSVRNWLRRAPRG